MINRGVVLALVVVCISGLSAGQVSHKLDSKMSGRSLSANMHVAPDLKQRLARFRQVQMPFHSEGLSPREQKMIAKLVEASRYLDDIYWRQVDPEGLELYQSLEGSTNPQDVEL